MNLAFASGQVLGSYELESPLGRGAFGEVWLAGEHGGLGLKRKVALKLITAVTDERSVKDLLHEARLCGYLDHPHVISVEQVVQLSDAHFIVMEFIDGEDLAHLFRDLKSWGLRFPCSVLLDIGIAVASAIHHAWNAVDPDGTALKIVHRDLKPHNVMISRRGEVKVADFGIAKAAPDVTVTATGILKGTPTYLAPEIWAGSRALGPPVDLFSLGIILWEMAMGQRFFGGAPISRVMDLLVLRTGEDDAKLLRPVLPGLEPIVARLLDRDPSGRHQSASELVDDLSELRRSVAAPGTVEDFMTLVAGVRATKGEGTGSGSPASSLVGDLGDWKPLVLAMSGESDSKESVADKPAAASPGTRRPRRRSAPRVGKHEGSAGARKRGLWLLWGVALPVAGALLIWLLRARGHF